MKVLGIETSCDETAAAVVEDGRRILSDVVFSQIKTHKKYGGVVPEIASRAHIEKIGATVASALEKAGVSIGEVDAIAVTHAPGLIGALLVGVNFAKALSFASGKTLVPVHHIKGHVAANYLAFPELTPPFLSLVASGGHSEIVGVEDYTTFQTLGRTRDDAAGEAFDKVSRVLGLGYPGGAAIDAVSEGVDPSAIRFPVVEFQDAPYDFSFSGVKTAVVNYIHNARQKGETVDAPRVAASFQDAVARALSGKLIRCACDKGLKKIALGGGVAANTCLRSMLKKMCEEKNLSLFLPPPALCGDNGAMIAAQGYYEAVSGHSAGLSLNAKAVLPVGFAGS